MKIQGIAISIEDLKRIEKQLKIEIKDIEKLGILKKEETNKIKFQLNIINYPSKTNSHKKYLSDTWEFEMLRKKEYV